MSSLLLPLRFDPSRGCGSKSRSANRYTRLELENVAHSYGVKTKGRNMDKICKELKKIVKTNPNRRIDRCIDKMDPITQEEYMDDSDIIYIAMLSDRKELVDKVQCLLRDTLISTFTNSNKVYQWTVNRDSVCCPNVEYQVYKDPMMGIWYLKSALESIQNLDHVVYVAVPVAEHTIGSSYSSSSLHGSNVMLHYLWKLPLSLMDKWWSGKLTTREVQGLIDRDDLPNRLSDELLPYDIPDPAVAAAVRHSMSRRAVRPAARRGGRVNAIARGASIYSALPMGIGNNIRLERSNVVPLNRDLFTEMMMADVYVPPPTSPPPVTSSDDDEDDELIDEIFNELTDSDSSVY